MSNTLAIDASIEKKGKMDFLTAEKSDSDWKIFRSLLRRCGYTTDAIRNLLGLRESVEEMLADTGRCSFIYIDELAEIDTPASILAQLFMLCGWVPAAKLDHLDPELSSLLWRLGLIEPVTEDPRFVHGVVALTEFAQCYFLSDALFENKSGDFVVHGGGDRCMPPHASSLELLAGLRRPPLARSFLDIGCGTGCQSILFASEYERVTGFDPSPRSVGFARINSLMNGARSAYQICTWESFEDADPYDHVVFNAPDCHSAFEFINSGIAKVLAGRGLAQVGLTCEVTQDDGSFEGTLRRRIRNPDNFHLETLVNAGSPFAISPEFVRARRLPQRTLLVSHPADEEAYVQGLIERRVIEVVSATLSFTHSGTVL